MSSFCGFCVLFFSVPIISEIDQLREYVWFLITMYVLYFLQLTYAVNQGIYECNNIPSRMATAPKKGKGSPYSITERRVPDLIPVLGSR